VRADAAIAMARSGCARAPMTPDQAVAALRSPDPETRRRAADDLRGDDTNGVRPAAVAPLLDALAAEPEPADRGAILLTLGRSGAPEAKDPIDRAMSGDPAPDVRRAAKRALAYWKAQNGLSSNGTWSYWVPFWSPATKVGPD
jgi:HEAT repeat protein